MNIYDLTQLFTAKMPVYPGTEPPVIETVCTLDGDGFVEKKLAFYSHTGTHMDAPAHVLPHGKPLDAYAAAWFTGQAVIIKVPEKRNGCIEKENLVAYRELLAKADYCLLCTGWSRYWGQPAYFAHYPVLTPTAAAWLTGQGLKGIGVDTISVDAVTNPSLPIHKTILEKELVIIENLTNLAPLAGQLVTFYCLPLNIENADGAPVRVIAIQK